jgi:hypothetical protein
MGLESHVGYGPNCMNSAQFLETLLAPRLESKAMAWVRSQALGMSQGISDNALFFAFSQAVRHAGKGLLSPTQAEAQTARGLDPHWDLREWTLDVTVRAYFMAMMPDSPETPARLMKVHQTADLGEHIALVKALFLAPRCEAALHIAREGLRSNMRSVFAGITAHNPFPARYFDELAFNQMVVKCLFVDLPLRDIAGLDSRLNATLAQILIDLAHERWAAERLVSPEMWRCVGPFANDLGRAGMLKALDAGLASEAGTRSAEARGAALGMMRDPSGASQLVLQQKTPGLVADIREGRLTWENYDHA